MRDIMKKMLIGLMTIGLALLYIGTEAFAAGSSSAPAKDWSL
jgi:hypothetical protein